MKRIHQGQSGWAALTFLVATFAVVGCDSSSSTGDESTSSGTTDSASGTGGTASGGLTTGTGGTVNSGGAGTGGASTSSAGTGGPLPQGDLAAAQAFIEPLVLGMNIERGWAWSMPGVDSAGSTEYWDYLKNTVGITHVRLFYPWRPSVTMGGGGPNNSPPDQGGFNRILDASEQAIKAGLKVFLDCADVMGTEDFTGDNGDATEGFMVDCAKWTVARNFDPSMLAIGPVNEWAGGDDNTTYNEYRQHYHDVLRAELPGYVLTTGPGYWKSRDWIYDESKKFAPFNDMRVIYEWHHYSTLDAEGWKEEASKLAGWRAANGGRPTICGEAGAGYWDEQIDGKRLATSPSVWPALFEGMLPSIAAERPSIWAVTYGGEYRVNKSADDAHVMDGSNGSTNLLKSFLDSEAAMKAVLGK
ncbi:MAG: cellulase family glycosylhydrolase [Byssovorax sp.]